jgi:hypothetical protein
MPTSDAKNCERGMTGEGVEEVNHDRPTRSAEFTEKNFGRLLIFFRLLFLLNLPVSNETPAAKASGKMKKEAGQPCKQSRLDSLRRTRGLFLTVRSALCERGTHLYFLDCPHRADNLALIVDSIYNRRINAVRVVHRLILEGRG